MLISITSLENLYEVFCINFLFVDICIISKGFLPQFNLIVELSDNSSNRKQLSN